MAETTRYGICTNKTHCSLAFNREMIIVPPNGACPECGRPLRVNTMFSKILRFVMLLIFLGALCAGGYYAKKTYLDGTKYDIHNLSSWWNSPKPGPTPNGGSPSSSPDPTDTPMPSAGPVKAPEFKRTVENNKAREDVLKRVDVMPHLTDTQKDQLRDAVNRARNMGCIFVIPFQNGQKTLDRAGSDILYNGFKSASIQKLMQDPTVIFVVLGYADKQSDAGNSEKTSIERAQSVLMAMKDRCGVVNVTYGVGMGGTELYEGRSSAKNRLVEIWAAFP